MSSNLDRRDFLKQAAAAGLSLGLASQAFAQGQPAPGAPKKKRAGKQGGKRGPKKAPFVNTQEVPAGERVNVAVIGVNGRGMAHLQCLLALAGVTITHICDVDSRALAKAIKYVQDATGKAPAAVKDFRKVLDDKSVDAITIATPDHWHTPMSIMALAAGKHVYCEKPATHNPHEMELLTAAVKQYGKIYQMGNQRRSFGNLIRAIEQIHAGTLIGKAVYARAWYNNTRKPIGVGKVVPVPEWLGADGYELWQGPAPRLPYKDNMIHYNWHWRWHWGTGEALNNGTHEVDVCRWALGVTLPERVVSTGGRFCIQGQDDWETPDTQMISWNFPENKAITWEGRSCIGMTLDGKDRGAMIYGTDGSALLDGNTVVIYDAKGKPVPGKELKGNAVDATNTVTTDIVGDKAHFNNFIEAVRGKVKANSPVTEGPVSCQLLHLGNIAWRTGSQIVLDPATGKIKDNAEAMKLWAREYEKSYDPAQFVKLG